MSTVANSLATPATSRARATTSSSDAPARARRAASSATNPSAIDAFVESTTTARPSNRSAAVRATWWTALIVDATVIQTMSRCRVRSKAAANAPGDGVAVDAGSRSLIRRS